MGASVRKHEEPRRCWYNIRRGLPEPEIASIYALVEMDTLQFRYIGKTHKTIRARFSGHIAEAKSGGSTPKCQWIREMLEQGRSIGYAWLETVPYGVWPQAEAKWMNWARQEGYDLVNSQGAGGGA